MTRYFVSENVQVAVGVVLTLSGPTQAAGNVMASGPETDEAAAASAPAPENEHPGGKPFWLVTVKVTEVSCDPETVPASVVWIFALFASRTMVPETLVPLCVAVHDRTGTVGGRPCVAMVPVHVPARLSVGVEEAEGDVGELLRESSSPHATLVMARAKTQIVIP